MDEPLTLHVVASPGEERQRIADALGAQAPTMHDSIESLRRHGEGNRCAVVVDVAGGVDRGQLLRMCADVADGDREWIVLISEEDGSGGIVFRPLSAGFAVEPDDLVPTLSNADDERPLFDLHEVLRFVARVRHDINNPLTAGMAETQLLLMDLGGEGEVGESLQTIERQLQRIQVLIEDLTRLRRPVEDGS